MPFPLPPTMLAEAQARLGVLFPPSFAARMQRDNGGEVVAAHEDWFLFPVADTTDRKRLARTANHVERETALARGWPGFPPGAVAIANNGGGDLLVFLPDAADPTRLAPAVHAWRHEGGEVELVAEGFEELAGGDDR